MSIFALTLLPYLPLKSKFIGFGVVGIPSYIRDPKLILNFSYAALPEEGLFGIQVGSWLYGGSWVTSSISDRDTLTLNLSGLTIYAGPTIGKPKFYVSPVVGLGIFRANRGAPAGGLVGLKFSMLTRYNLSLIDFFAGYTVVYGKRYDTTHVYIGDTFFLSPVVTFSINPLYFTPTYPFVELPETEREKYIHGIYVPLLDETNNFAMAFSVERYPRLYALDFQFSYGRYSLVGRKGAELTVGLRKLYFPPEDTLRYLPSVAYMRVRPFWGNDMYNVGPYFSIGIASDGKRVAGGTYSFGMDFGFDIFHLELGMSKVFVGNFYDPYDVLLGKVDAPDELKNFPLHGAKLVPKVSGGFRFVYQDGRIKSRFFMLKSPPSYAIFTLSLGSYLNKQLKLTLLDFFAIRNIRSKPFGVAVGFETATISLAMGDSAVKVREPSASLKLGLDVAGENGSLILYGIAGSNFDGNKPIYGAGLRIGLATYEQLFGISFYNFSMDIRYLNTWVWNDDRYLREYVLGFKFGISYHIPIVKYLQRREREMMKPVSPGVFD